jgi:cell division protein FtsW
VPIKQRFDRILLTSAILLTAVGLAMLGSASWVIASERYGRPPSFFLTWQAAVAVVGLGLLVLCMHLKAELLGDARLAAAGVAAAWLMLAAAFLMPPVANTHRWLSVGGISLQPSVMARPAMIFFAAIHLTAAQRDGWSTRRLAILGLPVVVTAGLIAAAPDLGSAALIVLVVGAMAFVSGMPMRLFAAPVALGLPALVVAVLASPYRLERVRAFLDPSAATAASFQSNQSLLAIGSGGLFGRGYGSGFQKLGFLPEPHTDFIFSITGEEFGLMGLLVLIGLAAVIVWRGLKIAVGQSDPTRALLAFGLCFAFAAQTLIHMVVCLDLLPPKGIPLPLVSYGKTDLVVTLASIGLLLNLSREASP